MVTRLCVFVVSVLLASTAYPVKQVTQSDFARTPDPETMSKVVLRLIKYRNRLTNKEYMEWRGIAVQVSDEQKTKLPRLRSELEETRDIIDRLNTAIAANEREITRLEGIGVAQLKPAERKAYDKAKADVDRYRRLLHNAGQEFMKRDKKLKDAEWDVHAWLNGQAGPPGTDRITKTGDAKEYERRRKFVEECYRELRWIIRHFVSGALKEEINFTDLDRWLKLSPDKLPSDLLDKLQIQAEGSFKDMNYVKAFTNPTGINKMTSLLMRYHEKNGISEADVEIAKKMLAFSLKLATETQATNPGAEADVEKDARLQVDKIYQQQNVSLHDIITMYDQLAKTKPTTTTIRNPKR